MISLKTPAEIDVMHEGGRILAGITRQLLALVRPGIATKELDKEAGSLIVRSGAQVAFKGYEGFPATLCTSVNEEVVHAIPSKRVLQTGDLITLDIGLIWKGFYLDMARSVIAGKGSPTTEKLLQTCQEALRIGTRKARVGNRLGEVGYAIQQFVEGKGYGVVRELCGHGIGRDLHEPPHVLNYGEKNEGERLREGMVICIEPMITMGDWEVKRSQDGQGFETKDGSWACQFEDTVAITSRGPRVLTQEK